MMQQRHRVAIGVLLSVAAVLAGCGNGSGGTGTSDGGKASLTKEQFVKEGDQICRRNYTRRGEALVGYLAKEERTGAPPPLAEQEIVLVNRIIPIFREESEKLDELGLPTSETQQAKAILKALEAAIAAVEAEPGVAVRKGTAVQFSRVEHLAQSYGFSYCGRS